MRQIANSQDTRCCLVISGAEAFHYQSMRFRLYAELATLRYQPVSGLPINQLTIVILYQLCDMSVSDPCKRYLREVSNLFLSHLLFTKITSCLKTGKY